MEKLKKLIYSVYYLPENLIYSVKYLPQILYFGGLGFFFYAISIAGTGNDFIPFVNSVCLPFTGFFLYITLIAMKNYRTKREFGGKGCWKRYSSRIINSTVFGMFLAIILYSILMAFVFTSYSLL